MPLAWAFGQLSVIYCVTTSKLGPSGADSKVGRFVYVLGPRGSLQQTVPWGWEFLPSLRRPQIFIVRGFEALFFLAGTLGCMVCLAPQLFLLVFLFTNVGLPSLPVAALPILVQMLVFFILMKSIYLVAYKISSRTHFWTSNNKSWSPSQYQFLFSLNSRSKDNHCLQCGIYPFRHFLC